MSVTTPGGTPPASPTPPAPSGPEHPSAGPPLPSPPPIPHRSRRWRWAVAAAAVVAVAGLTAGLLWATGGNDSPPAPTSSTTTTTAPSTTTTTAPAPPSAGDLSGVVYPTLASGVTFTHPVAAARAFAVDFVGFTDPLVGSFHADGAATGTVPVRASASGPVTTVTLQRLGDSWWVAGSQTPDIVLSSPVAGATVASPVRLQGTSTAFEAQVAVEVRQDGQRTPLGTGYVMGGSMGVMGPFDGSVAFAAPSAARGALVLSTVSMADGRLWEATVVRAAFVSTTALTPSSPCPDYAMDRPVAPAGERVVEVFYTCGPDAAPVASYRLVPATTAVLRSALDQLLAGPTPAESAAGLTSWFSTATAGYVAKVTITDGAAVVDFGDLRPVIPNASTSAGSHVLLAQLDATVFQFPSVRSVQYRIDGSCETFFEWLQLAGCQVRTPPASS